MRTVLIICLPLLTVLCSARPGWVHSMPQSPALAAGSHAVLPAGVWERNARNRHPMVHRTHYSDSREVIETRADQTYLKVHLFAQVTDTTERFTAYRESGRWTPGAGSWILFQPERAERFEAESAVKHPYRGPDTRYPFPSADSIAFQSASPPAALLYLYEETDRTSVLLPATYEHLGRVYNFGVYEGSETAFDSSSARFERTKKTYLSRRFQEFHYALVREKSE